MTEQFELPVAFFSVYVKRCYIWITRHRRLPFLLDGGATQLFQNSSSASEMTDA